MRKAPQSISVLNPKERLLERIREDKAVVGVIGMGYVGLPLAVSFAASGLNTLGFDVDPEKVRQINLGNSNIQDVSESELSDLVIEKRILAATTDFGKISSCDALIICVPTPLDRFKKPDMTAIRAACTAIGKHMKSGCFICLESTTYPTTTEEYMLPLLEQESGFTEGRDFWLAYSPERVDPGNTVYNTRNTPKVIGANNPDGLEIGQALYKKAVAEIHAVSSPRAAEMVKILENTYRLVNISLINELALLSGKMDIDIWEVIEAAKTKPFGFQAFYPGPGIGGHCIPLDPFYLEHIAKKYNFDLSMIHAAGHINMRMPHYMYIKIATSLNRHKKAVNGSRILFMGAAYKPNVNDARESPALSIMSIVAHKGGEVIYHDPYIPEIELEDGSTRTSAPLRPGLIQSADCVVLTTNHEVFEVSEIQREAAMIVDLRNMISKASDKVYKL